VDLLLASGYGFLLVLFRTSGLVMGMPLWSATAIPGQVKVAVAFALSWAAFSGAGAPHPAVPADPLALAGAGLVEVLVGLLAGHAARVAVEAASSAGHFAATSMGLTYGNMLDPINGGSSNAVAEFLNLLANCTAIAIGLHREAVVWLARSLREHPPGSLIHLREMAMAAADHIAGAMALGLRLGYPYVLVVTFSHALLGLVSRAAPQLSINSIGFSVSLIVGWGALYVTAPLAAQLAVRAAVTAFGAG
jgi:flagellar biosynthetic protein FliR